MNYQNKQEKYRNNSRLYSVKDSHTMTAEELINNIRDKIQNILIEKAEQSGKPVNPENN